MVSPKISDAGRTAISVLHPTQLSKPVRRGFVLEHLTTFRQKGVSTIAGTRLYER
jgi:hypothetical protein